MLIIVRLDEAHSVMKNIESTRKRVYYRCKGNKADANAMIKEKALFFNSLIVGYEEVNEERFLPFSKKQDYFSPQFILSFVK